ncbi:MAG: large subunit ribosomal protein [Patescibacteria group bacterium]|nr:large subunit ribosomal protein [Patescibacteria group bacterium]
MTKTVLSITTAPRVAKETKKEGFIPAVYYGSHMKSTPIFINAIEFSKVYGQAGESSTLTLVTEHGNENALVQDVQYDPVKNTYRHVDFYVLEKGQKVDVEIPIVFVGESNAVKEGGILVKVLYELGVQGDPTALPHEFTVDISSLKTPADVIKVSDITLPKGVELYHVNPNDIIASIAIAEDEPEEVAPVADLSAIEVEKKGKTEEEGEAPEA